MHLVLMTRGIKHEVDRFINELSTRYLPMKNMYDCATKKMHKDMNIQMRVSPIQLWDISFPEENLDAVLTTCLAGDKGKPIHGRNKKYIWALKKAMGLKDIPQNYKTDKILIMRPPQNIELLGVGIKDDYWFTPEGKKVDKKNKTDKDAEGI